MKEIRAIVRPHRLATLREALRTVHNFPGFTVFKVKGFTAPAALHKHTVKEELTDFSDKLMVCVLADDAMADTIRQVIVQSCTTGQVGDGIVWRVDIENMHRIRDGSLVQGS